MRVTLKLAILLFLTALPALVFAYTGDDYYKAGLTFYQQKDYTKAIQYFKAAVQMDPTNWQAYQVLGSSYYQSGDKTNALASFDQSLQLHPDNPSLKAYADNLRAQTVVAATAPNSAEVPVLVPRPQMSSYAETPESFNRQKWFNLHTGVIYATLGDLPGAATAFNSAFPASVTHSASCGNVGFLIGAEGGLAFNPENAIAVNIDFGLFSGYSDMASNGIETGTDTFQPDMLACEFEYVHFFPMGRSRLRVGVGPGVYYTLLSVSEVLDGTSLANGQMNGPGFGGVLDFAWETDLGGQLTLNIFARGRFATTTNIQGTATDSFGNTEQIGLATSSQGTVGIADTSVIGTNGIRWANIDYTGGEAGIGISYHY